MSRLPSPKANATRLIVMRRQSRKQRKMRGRKVSRKEAAVEEKWHVSSATLARSNDLPNAEKKENEDLKTKLDERTKALDRQIEAKVEIQEKLSLVCRQFAEHLKGQAYMASDGQRKAELLDRAERIMAEITSRKEEGL